MGLSCTFGFHSWGGCKCTKCGKTRDEKHDWSMDCDKCAGCGKTRENAHGWDGDRCIKCGKTNRPTATTASSPSDITILKKYVKITNPLAVDFLLLKSVIHKAQKQGISIRISWNDNCIDSTTDIFGGIYFITHYGDILDIELEGVKNDTMVEELTQAINDANREVSLHLHDTNTNKQTVLTIFTYALFSQRGVEQALRFDPDLQKYDFHTCYLEPTKEMNLFAEKATIMDFEAGLRIAGTSLSGWSLRDGELISAHPMFYYGLMQRKTEHHIEQICPHIVLMHYGDAFYFADGIFHSAINELKYRYVDIIFIMDNPQKHAEMGWPPIDEEQKNLVSAIFPNSGWMNYGI